MQRFLKSRYNSCKICVKGLIFSAVADLHLASLLENVTYPLQVFYKDTACCLRQHLFLGQP